METGGGGSAKDADDEADPVIVDLPTSACTDGVLARLKSLLSLHPGTLRVHIQLLAEDATTRVRLGDEFRVDGSPGFLSELRGLLGPEAVRLTEEPMVRVLG